MGDASEIDRSRGKTIRAPHILKGLVGEYPNAEIELDYRNAFELVTVVALSAQSTDVKVNEISPALFKAFPTPDAIAPLEPEDLHPYLNQLGLYRNKSKNLVGMARMLVDEFDGEVPNTMEDLIKLPGVARKTANVVLSNAFGINEGVVVDTHITRLSLRLAFTDNTEPVKIERDLMRLFERDDYLRWADVLIFHGRRVCDAKKPDCGSCAIEDLCPSSQVAGKRDRFRTKMKKSKPRKRR